MLHVFKQVFFNAFVFIIMSVESQCRSDQQSEACLSACSRHVRVQHNGGTRCETQPGTLIVGILITATRAQGACPPAPPAPSRVPRAVRLCETLAYGRTRDSRPHIPRARDNARQIEFNIHRADVRFSEFNARTSDPSLAYKRPSLNPRVYFK